MKKILILNGPNLNMLGTREPEIYGRQTLKDIEKLCAKTAKELGVKIDFRQSNHEGELVDWIQGAVKSAHGVIINAAAYTHTSIAIHDALKMLKAPIIEVHLSDLKKRDKFRRHSYIEPLAAKVIAGKGAQGYVLALKAINNLISH
jgi:3-dehydroquinate dehydratase II